MTATHFLGALAGAATLATVVAANEAAVPLRPGSNGEFIADHYPPEALKRGEQGKVAFRLTMDRDGLPTICEVTESSGFATLDRETCDLLVRYAQARPPIDSQGRRARATKMGYIVWRLPSSSVPLAAVTGATMPIPDPLICKRSLVTGSSVKKIRRCLTAAEWKRHEQETRERLNTMVGPIYCSDHGC